MSGQPGGETVSPPLAVRLRAVGSFSEDEKGGYAQHHEDADGCAIERPDECRQTACPVLCRIGGTVHVVGRVLGLGEDVVQQERDDGDRDEFLHLSSQYGCRTEQLGYPESARRSSELRLFYNFY